MDNFTNDLSVALDMSMLEEDVITMIMAYKKNMMCEIKPRLFQTYKCPMLLYTDIVKIVTVNNMHYDLLELMPIIDTYIDNCFIKLSI